VIENVRLRSVFLMLRPGLCNQEIPHRTKLRSRIMELWELHVHDLKKKMQVRPSLYNLLGILSSHL